MAAPKPSAKTDSDFTFTAQQQEALVKALKTKRTAQPPFPPEVTKVDPASLHVPCDASRKWKP